MQHAYSFLDRLLHRLAFQAPGVAEMSFDLDQSRLKPDATAVCDERHVFVTGLARAGTTALMRAFHQTGGFRSLTYRDMPFVLAPGFGDQMRWAGAEEVEAVERAHGDRIKVSVESPEALDEVFWQTFCGRDYVRKDHLLPHPVSAELREKFQHYVAAILKTGEADKQRYLSKNNNNILRLSALRAMFPKALIVIPFRTPLDHAASLLGQHQRFTKMQAEDSFVKAYMGWLGHYEFGAGHRPFWFCSETDFEASAYSPDTMDYWLERWIEAHDWLDRRAPRDAVFVSYEALCSDPAIWQDLKEKADLSGPDQGEMFSASTAKARPDVDPSLLWRATELHQALLMRCAEISVKTRLKTA